MERRGWDGSLATGDERVDADHRRLFELFDGLLDVEEQQQDGHAIQAALEELTDYVAVHFAHEQDLMRHAGYPERGIAAHEAEHHKLTDRTREMVLEYRDGKLEIEELVEFLGEWLTEHILQVDRLLIAHVKAVEKV